MRRFRPSHYWRKHLHELAARKAFELAAEPLCHAEATVAMLSHAAQPSLSWFSRLVAILTTPFKRLGISGWKETGCIAEGEGVPVRPAQHSTDGFWTVDLHLSSLCIGTVIAPRDRYLRLEVEPGTDAHDVCERIPVTSSSQVSFGGVVVVDTDGPFLEVHPDHDFRVI